MYEIIFVKIKRNNILICYYDNIMYFYLMSKKYKK